MSDDTDDVPDVIRALVNPNSADAATFRAIVDAKRWATLQARFALAGFELVRLADGTLLASRWGMFGSLANLYDAEAFLKRAAGPSA
jgi:hypothetical protein